MAALEEVPVEVRLFKPGSVEEVLSLRQASDLAAGLQLLREQFPQLATVRCCEQEAEGGCVFVYPSPKELALDEADAASDANGTPAGYGRWVGLISAAEKSEPNCSRPAAHMRSSD